MINGRNKSCGKRDLASAASVYQGYRSDHITVCFSASSTGDMGIGIAIAAIATVATIATDIGFSVEANKKEDELKREVSNAQTAVSSANDFYENVYKFVKSRLERLQQNMKKLPSDVVAKLNSELQLDLSDPGNAVKYAGWALGGTQAVAGVVSGVTSYLVGAGAAEAEDILAGISEVAGAAGAALAVAGFGLALYCGITELHKLDKAIGEVRHKRQQAKDALTRMKQSLDGLLKRMHLQIGGYDQLRKMSDDWYKLSLNFDKYSKAFYLAITGFAMGKAQSDVHLFIASRGGVDLKDDVLALAKIIQEGIFGLMHQGKTDEQIINFYAKENPHEGLRFVLDSFFVENLRSFLH